MLSAFVLSYDSYIYVENQKLFVYRWVKVDQQQVKEDATSILALPDDRPGEIVRYSIEGQGYCLLRVLGDGRLRELTDNEKNAGDPVKLNVPRI